MRPGTVIATVACLIIVHGPDRVRGDETSDFRLAIAKAEIDKVKQALAKDARVANRRNEHDFTPLFQAAMPGRTAMSDFDQALSTPAFGERYDRREFLNEAPADAAKR